MNSARTYDLFRQYCGKISPHWQYLGVPKVPGVLRIGGELQRPDPDFIVRASSVTQACWFAYESVATLDRDDGLGVHEFRVGI